MFPKLCDSTSGLTSEGSKQYVVVGNVHKNAILNEVDTTSFDTKNGIFEYLIYKNFLAKCQAKLSY